MGTKSDCPHNRQIADNYGVTCQDCGEPLAGYGYWSEDSRTCIHKFVDDGVGGKVCLYCDRDRGDLEAQAAHD